METTDLTFANELRLLPLDLPRAALRFAREIAYPDLDVDTYLARIDELVGLASESFPSTASAHQKAAQLAETLFERLGFRGNSANYDDPRNNYLNEVLDRRLGIPITLSVLYVTVAQKLGLPACGVGLPGHFIVCIEDPEGSVYMDPFNGGKPLTVDDCARLVEQTTFYRGSFQMNWLEPTAPLDILARMLNNLRRDYMHLGDWRHAVAAVEHLRLVEPDQPEHLRELGLLHHQNGSLRLAVDYYETYLKLVPQAPDAETVTRSLRLAARQLAERN